MAKNSCRPEDVALKTFFLGPQAENIDQVTEVFAHILSRWAYSRKVRYPSDGHAISVEDQISRQFTQYRQDLAKNIDKLMNRLESEIPHYSPRYLGHMFSEISLPALYGALLGVLYNPNNISAEASKVGLEMEAVGIRQLSRMMGMPSSAVGHFTSCGTLANFEAVLRARVRTPRGMRLGFCFPKHAHYGWAKIVEILGIPSRDISWIDLDSKGRMRTQSLETALTQFRLKGYRSVFVLSVFGTTEFGICDPVDEVDKLLRRFRKKELRLWHHVDAAYGGFFASLRGSKRTGLSPYVQKAMKGFGGVDSLTIDPHKLGYLPYACGGFLCRSRSQYVMPSVASPYLAHAQGANSLWTIEGSRSAQGALGVVLASLTMRFNQDGFGRILNINLNAQRELQRKLSKLKHLKLLPADDLNISGFVFAKKGESTSRVSRRSLSIYRALSPENAKAEFIVTKTRLDRKRYGRMYDQVCESWGAQADSDLEVLRVCLMNPFLGSKEPEVNYIDEFVASLDRLAKKFQ